MEPRPVPSFLYFMWLHKKKTSKYHYKYIKALMCRWMPFLLIFYIYFYWHPTGSSDASPKIAHAIPAAIIFCILLCGGRLERSLMRPAGRRIKTKASFTCILLIVLIRQSQAALSSAHIFPISCGGISFYLFFIEYLCRHRKGK